MHLEEARTRKEQLRAAGRDITPGSPIPSFATGIGLTERPGEVRLAIFLTEEQDRVILNHPAIREVLDPIRPEVDIEVIGEGDETGSRTKARAVTARINTLRVGTSIGHHRRGGGTLGFFAQRVSDSARGVVSCNHVIALRDVGVNHAPIVSPSVADGGGPAFGLLDGTYPPLFAAGKRLVDAAFARFDPAKTVPFDPRPNGSTLNPTPPTVVAITPVTKIGKTTGLTEGLLQVMEIDDFRRLYGLKRVVFDDVLRVLSPARAPRFSDGGDSGSLVYTTRTLQPVGILFFANALGTSWVNPMRHVTKLLGVDLIVTP